MRGHPTREGSDPLPRVSRSTRIKERDPSWRGSLRTSDGTRPLDEGARHLRVEASPPSGGVASSAREDAAPRREDETPRAGGLALVARERDPSIVAMRSLVRGNAGSPGGNGFPTRRGWLLTSWGWVPSRAGRGPSDEGMGSHTAGVPSSAREGRRSSRVDAPSRSRGWGPSRGGRDRSIEGLGNVDLMIALTSVDLLVLHDFALDPPIQDRLQLIG